MSESGTTGEQRSGLTVPRGEEDSQSVVPTRIGRFPIVERIGSGGMGRVYLGIDTSLNRDVAIKVLRATGERSKALVLREAQSLAKLSHENVVGVYEVGLDGGFVFIAMEYVEGVHLGRWLAGDVSDDEVLDAFIQAGRGLAAAHARGMVHRDFKLSNAMVDGSGRVRVLDFGVAQLEDEGTIEGSQQVAMPGTRTGPGVLGTPIYMAPEQHAGGTVTPAADQFSFCVALWRALYDKYPFAGSGDALVGAKRRGELTAPTRRISRRVQRALVRGLSADPAERFESMEHLLRELAVAKPSPIGLVAPAAVVVAVVAVAAWPTAEPPGCEGGDTRVREVWNEARGAEIRAAFEAAPVPYGETAWARASQDLDAYAHGWEEAHHEVCAARGAELDARMACLSGELDQLSALLDVMARADATVVESAVGAVDKLDPPARCAAGSVDAAAPDDVPAVEAARVLGAVRRARAGLAAGHREQALARAQEAARGAAELRSPALDLEVQAVLGECLAAAGQYDAAAAAYEAAFFGARERDPTRALSLAVRLVSTHASAARPDDADAWVRHAEAQFERAPPGPEVEHELLLARGEALVARQDYAAAKVAFERAATFARQELLDADERLARSLHNLAVTHSELGDWQQARTAYEQALEIRGRLFGRDHPRAADTLANLANTYIYAGEHSEALSRLEDALVRAVAAYGREDRRVGAILSNIGVALFRLGRIEEAHARLSEALEVTRVTLGDEHPRVAALTANLATATKKLGRLDEATAHFERVVALVEASRGVGSRQLVEPLITLGNILCDQERFESGLARYRRAEEISVASLGEAHPMTQHAHLATAVALHGLERPREAADILEKVLVARNRPGFTPSDRAEVRFHLARTLWDAGRDKSRAKELMAEARALIADAEDAVDHLRQAIEAWSREHG